MCGPAIRVASLTSLGNNCFRMAAAAGWSMSKTTVMSGRGVTMQRNEADSVRDHLRVEDAVAASLPVAYLTAQIMLALAGFKPGMTVLAPGIGGSVGNATYQLSRTQGVVLAG
jgi:NADPH:quinone reductase-like Zn-dependent oxidoreductase